MNNKTVLVTGGAGYIGTNTIALLLENKYDVIVIDNLSNSSILSLNKVMAKSGKDVKFYFGSIGDKILLEKIFTENKIFAVIHLAAFKSVHESMVEPQKYIDNNVTNFKTLLSIMNKYNVKKIIFPSSVTVYKYDISAMPYSEDCAVFAKSPYAQTKIDCEDILNAMHKFDSNWNIVIFRYSNPISANLEYQIGDSPTSNKTNLVPYISQNCETPNFEFKFYGNNFDTVDGTGERDYVHIIDIARANLLALNNLENIHFTKLNVSGNQGWTVLQVVQEFENDCGHDINYQFLPQRSGDVASIIVNNNKIYDVLNWSPEHNFIDMISDEYKFRNKK